MGNSGMKYASEADNRGSFRGWQLSASGGSVGLGAACALFAGY